VDLFCSQEMQPILSNGPIIRYASEQGWIDQAGIEKLKAEFLARGEYPDAFRAAIWFESIGWVD
jgi:hypothetical protein